AGEEPAPVDPGLRHPAEHRFEIAIPIAHACSSSSRPAGSHGTSADDAEDRCLVPADGHGLARSQSLGRHLPQLVLPSDDELAPLVGLAPVFPLVAEVRSLMDTGADPGP